jgi:transcriptional regulator with XRE-family HTH domain
MVYVDAADVLRTARQRAGMSLRELADRADTSHSTLSAYESGRKVPRVDTLERIVRAAGQDLGVELGRRVVDGDRGLELAEALELAEQFPVRHVPTLQYPPFASARRGPRRVR